MANRLSPPQAETEERARYEARMTLIEHLDELRVRIFKVLVAFILAAIVCGYFYNPILDLLLEPAPSLDGNLNFTAPAEAFFTTVKLALWAAFVLTVPVLLYQGWAFAAPAVGDVGRVVTYIIIALASSLFLAGVVFGYLVVLPVAMDFLLNWGGGRFNPLITGREYLSFSTRLLLAFGVAFEMPAATYVGAKLGLIDAPMLRKYRRHSLVIIAIASAMLTPPDPFSMVLMMIPLFGLYELSILIARLVNPVSAASELDLPDDPDENGYRERDDRDL